MSKKTYMFNDPQDVKRLNRLISKRMKDLEQSKLYEGFWSIANAKYLGGFSGVEIISSKGELDRINYIS